MFKSVKRWLQHSHSNGNTPFTKEIRHKESPFHPMVEFLEKRELLTAENEQFVGAVYQDVLGREVDPVEPGLTSGRDVREKCRI